MNIKLFEDFKNGEPYKRYLTWISDPSIYDKNKKDIIEIPSAELLSIEKFLNKRGLIINQHWFNVFRIVNQSGDIDACFYKIKDDWFIYVDNIENQIRQEIEDDCEEEYFKCDQLYGFLKFLDDEFNGF